MSGTSPGRGERQRRAVTLLPVLLILVSACVATSLPADAATGTAPTSVEVSSTPAPGSTVSFGSPVQYWAEAFSLQGHATPPGNIYISVGSKALCTATRVNSRWHGCIATNAPVGVDTVVGLYKGNATYAPSRGQSTITVVRAPTAISVASSLNPAPAGEPVSLTGTLSPVPARSHVTFTANGAVIPGCAKLPVDPTTGTAVCLTSFPSPGTVTLRAHYAGAMDYVGSASGILLQSVT